MHELHRKQREPTKLCPSPRKPYVTPEDKYAVRKSFQISMRTYYSLERMFHKGFPKLIMWYQRMRTYIEQKDDKNL